MCAFLYEAVAQGFTTGRTPTDVIAAFERYSGLTYGADAEFAEAAATLRPDRALDVRQPRVVRADPVPRPAYPVLRGVGRPGPDRWPALMVSVLIAVFVAVLFVPLLSDYFGLTGPAAPVFVAVLPALVLWFGTRTVVYRVRLLDRILGLDDHARRSHLIDSRKRGTL